MANETNKDFRIKNVPKNLYDDVNNIADNLGVPTGSFIKVELRKIVDGYPEKMKTPQKKY